jgi:hypothetical protein
MHRYQEHRLNAALVLLVFVTHLRPPVLQLIPIRRAAAVRRMR